jgi:hypothetical protein
LEPKEGCPEQVKKKKSEEIFSNATRAGAVFLVMCNPSMHEL